MGRKYLVGHERHIEDLQWYYCESSTAMGVVSSHGSLVAIANGGTSGYRDPEVKVTDRLYGFEGRHTGTTRQAEIRRRLMAAGVRHEQTLKHAYGPLHWLEMLDERYGRGTMIRMQERYGDLVGVAILTKATVDGYESTRTNLSSERKVEVPLWQRKTDIWDCREGWLVATCQKGRADIAKKVRGQADTLLTNALSAYALESERLDKLEAKAPKRIQGAA